MKVSVEWLQTFFDKPLPEAETLADALTFGVAEIEEVVHEGEDEVIDIKVLPDRACYMLCHRGVAKELSILLDVPMKADPLAQPLPNLEELPASNLQVEIADFERCPLYSAARVTGVTVGPSPKWLARRLESLGQRSINNVVDATNYVMFTLGTPLHAFDAKKLQEKDGIIGIRVRAARNGEKITVLGGDEYELTQEMSVIADKNSDVALAIAGIKGGTHAEVDTQTTDIVLEAAKFASVRTRKASQALRLRTDASYRFENEITQELPRYGLVAVAQLIVEIAGGELKGYALSRQAHEVANPIVLTVAQVNHRLGTELSGSDIAALLATLGFAFKEDAGGSFTISVPAVRLDLSQPADVIEEIGRVYGYNNIKEQPLPKSDTAPVINQTYALSEQLREALDAADFQEVYTYSLCARGSVQLSNALASDKGYLRENLSFALSEKLAQNEANSPLWGLDAVRMYEIGNVFTERGEELHVAVAVRFPNGKKKESATREALEAAQEAISGVLEVGKPTREGTETLEWDITALVAKTNADEYPVLPRLEEGTAYKPFSAYPFVLRDIAAWAPAGTTAESFAELIEKAAGALLVRTDLFDQFTQPIRPDGAGHTGGGSRTSYAFRLVFQSPEKTLTDLAVNELMERVYAACREAGFEIR